VLVEQTGRDVGIGHVGGHRGKTRSEPFAGRVEVGPAAGDADDVRACGCQRACDGLPETSARAGDQHRRTRDGVLLKWCIHCVLAFDDSPNPMKVRYAPSLRFVAMSFGRSLDLYSYAEPK
jgi:hypothetical protein